MSSLSNILEAAAWVAESSASQCLNVACFLNDNWAAADATYNVLQAGLTRQASISALFFTSMRKLEYLFVSLDFISLAYTSRRLLYQVMLIGTPSVPIIAISTCALGALAFLGSHYIYSYFNKASATLPAIADQAANVEICTTKQEGHKALLYTARIIVNISLIVFLGPTIPLTLSIATEFYSLLNISGRKWVHIIYTITPSHTTITSARVVFSSIFFPASNPSDHCAVCCENNSEKTLYSCHPFHETCLLSDLIDQCRKLTEGIIFSNRSVQIKVQRSGTVKTRTTYAIYTATMNTANIPHCPSCRQEPTFYKVSVGVTDSAYRFTDTTIEWKQPTEEPQPAAI